MRVETIQIHWHATEAQPCMPVFSLDAGPDGRLATGGADNHVRVWRVEWPADGAAHVRHLASMDRHTGAVNCVRFAKDGRIASGSDDKYVFVWKRSEGGAAPSEGSEEAWVVSQVLSGHSSDVTSVAWSPTSARIVSGEVQHKVIVWDAASGEQIYVFKQHSKLVKGVAWDPLDQFIVSTSCDKTCNVYQIESGRVVSAKPKVLPSFAGDSIMALFRRPTWSPDGTFLVTPTGVHDSTSCTFLWHRRYLDKPLYIYSSPHRHTVATAFSPVLYKLQSTAKVHDGLPSYRMVFAVAYRDGVVIYDTERDLPLASIAGLHYMPITDLAWAPDGCTLFVSSAEGFVSAITFDPSDIGEVVCGEVRDAAVLEVDPSPQSPSKSDTKGLARGSDTSTGFVQSRV
ncbi:unnamed protein product (mitochondrion) [Plasmodiophora brassicae]|uniref:CAF1B/HIR1 beta-propeller domain-containing protein n=1 Tax=Plasmodiophora brassicae TaxID=37360 RepID=A0A3P3Y427_PLABS|nr:unnamed protein product [Plasmodiophora brassicae]